MVLRFGNYLCSEYLLQEFRKSAAQIFFFGHIRNMSSFLWVASKWWYMSRKFGGHIKFSKSLDQSIVNWVVSEITMEAFEIPQHRNNFKIIRYRLRSWNDLFLLNYWSSYKTIFCYNETAPTTLEIFQHASCFTMLRASICFMFRLASPFQTSLGIYLFSLTLGTGHECSRWVDHLLDARRVWCFVPRYSYPCPLSAFIADGLLCRSVHSCPSFRYLQYDHPSL